MRRRLVILLLCLPAWWIGAGAKMQQLSNLSTLYIDCNGQSGYINKEEYIDAEIVKICDADTTRYSQGHIRGRGNSTWVRMSKKPYALKFDKKERFLGPERANAKKWVLLANHADKTMIRNAVASKIGELMGQAFTAGTEFVDLVLDGKYIGTYQITDKVDIRKKRINIAEQDTVPGPDADISGGYLLEMDGIGNMEDKPVLYHNGYVVIQSPDKDVITKEQIAYIDSVLAHFTHALFSERYRDAVKGYRPLVDSLSVASWYLASEFTGNPDTFWSTYFYKDANDPRLHFGPMWDYDIAFNNCARLGDISSSLISEVGFHSTSQTGIWINRMLTDPWFRNLLGRLWADCLDNDITGQVLDYIDELAALLDESQRLNYSLYPTGERAYEELVLYSSYLDYIEYLKDDVVRRAELLTQVFAPEYAADSPSPLQNGRHYMIYNIGADMNLSFNDRLEVVLAHEGSCTERACHWRAEETPEGAYRFVNAANSLAITDNGLTSAGPVKGNNVTLTPLDEGAASQVWTLNPIDKRNDRFVVVNAETNLAWNNSSGSATAGNNLISWTNDAANPSKPTRQWYFVEVDNQDSIDEFESLAADYCVTYSRSDSAIRFITYSSTAELQGTYEFFTLNGQRILSGPIAPSVSLPTLSEPVYILRWTVGTHTRTIKLRI